MKNYAIEIKWAIIFIGVTLIWMILERLVGLHSTHIDKHAVYTNVFAIPAIAMFVFALLDKRKNFYSGTMSWKQGFFTGLIITAIVTLFVPLTQTIISNVITPDYFTNAIDNAVSSGKLDLEKAEKYFSMGSYIMQGLIGTAGMGIVTSAVVAIFTRK